MKRTPKADHIAQTAVELTRMQVELELAQRSRLLLMTTLERTNSENASLRGDIAELEKRLDDTTRALSEVTFERDVALSEKNRLRKILDQSTSVQRAITTSEERIKEKASHGSLAVIRVDELCRESRGLFEAKRYVDSYKMASRALTVNEHCLMAMELAGLCLHRMGFYSRARPHLLRVLKTTPERDDIRRVYSEVKNQLDRPTEDPSLLDG